MASAGQQITENELNISLPSGAPSKEKPEKTPILIDISADGEVKMNGEKYGNDKSLI